MITLNRRAQLHAHHVGAGSSLIITQRADVLAGISFGRYFFCASLPLSFS